MNSNHNYTPTDKKKDCELESLDLQKPDLPVQIENQNISFSFHNDDCIESNLLKIMSEIGAPDYAYKKIMLWAKDAFNTGYQFNPRGTNC